MSFINEMIEFVKYIKSNVKISWIGMAIIILLLIFFLIVKWILGKYKKGKSIIKENFKEFWNDLINLRGWQKVILVIGGVIFCVLIFGVCYWIKKPNPYQEIAILNNQNEVIYPIGVDILNERKVGDFTFFTYNMTEMIGNDVITYPALYKWKEN